MAFLRGASDADTASDRASLLAALADERVRVVNLCGPLGVGKTHLARQVDARWVSAREIGRLPLAHPGLVAVDEVDHDAWAAMLLSYTRRGGERLLVLSRRPLASRAGWAELPVRAVELAPWRSARIARLAGDAAGVAVRLSGGIPLIARCVLRSLRSGTPEDVVGALADAAAREIVRRLSRETRQPVEHPVRVVAATGGADEDLLQTLATGPFDRLARLSIVEPRAHGLTVAEPYRTVIDLAFRWRQPQTHRAVLAGGLQARLRQVRAQPDPQVRAALADQVLRLAADERFFPEDAPAVRLRPAEAGDEEQIARWIDRWAKLEELNVRRAGRMRDVWLSASPSGFHLAVDGDGTPVGMSNISGLHEGAVIEPLLQQHTPRLAGDGVLVGMMVTAQGHAAAKAVMLRHFLTAAVIRGRIAVSTPWAPYQQMAAHLGLSPVGQTRHDVYGCGRRSAVFTRAFTAGDLPAWLRRLQQPAPDPMAEAVRRALDSLKRGEPSAPSGDMLREQIALLLESGSAVDVQAGQVLAGYYLNRRGGHESLAHRLHLTRATYFRRLEHGVDRIARNLRDRFLL